MTVLDRSALEDSPLADLHAIASDLGIDGFRRLRKPDLVDAIVARQTGVPTSAPASDDDDGADEPETAQRPGSERPGSERPASERPARDRSATDRPARERPPRERPSVDADGERRRDDDPAGDDAAGRRRRGRRGGRGRVGREPGDAETETQDDGTEARADANAEAGIVEGVVELLANGSGFVRVSPPEPSDSDVYISAAQVKRCELVAGDKVSGPRRAPQRSERFASLVRIDTINGVSAADVADRGRFDELPAEFPSERFKLGSDDPTLKAIEWLTPFGRGSRVTIVGPAWSGKSHALRLLATELIADSSLTVFVVLAGVRPEEVAEWQLDSRPEPAATVPLGGSADAQDHAVELVVEQARRVAARGAHAVVLIDTLEQLHLPAARKALAAARKIKDGGSLTVIATVGKPLGGETTVIALDAELAATGRYPSLDLAHSGTLRVELLVGAVGAGAITQARLEAAASA